MRSWRSRQCTRHLRRDHVYTHLLADENIPLPIVKKLREATYDVRWIGEDSPGIDDRAVLHEAHKDQRVLLTFDKDFGTLTLHAGTHRPAGIVLFRLPPLAKDELVRFVLATVQSRDDWAGQFTVVTHHRIRMRPLPTH